jgi:hypothetical protein
VKQAILCVTLGCLAAGLAPAQTDRDEILKVDNQFRVAKLKNDVATLGLILADNVYSINQYGAARNKAQLLELWTTFTIQKLTTDSAEVRVTGDTAIVTGAQTEVNAMGTERMTYMRVYIRTGGSWKLLAVMQFIPPQA